MKENITDLMVKIPMFAGLNADELEIIKNHIELFEVKQGATLFEEGDQGDSVCFVVNGRLDVTKRTITGEDFVLNTLARGLSLLLSKKLRQTSSRLISYMATAM